MTSDLLFRRALAHHTDLVLGEDGPPEGFVGTVSMAASFPTITAQAQVAIAYGVQIAVSLSIPTASVTVQYRSETSRPVAGTAADAVQVAAPAQGVAAEHVQLARSLAEPVATHWQAAQHLDGLLATRWADAMLRQMACRSRFQRGASAVAGLAGQFQDAGHAYTRFGNRFQEAQPVSAGAESSFQDALRDRRLVLRDGFEEGCRTLSSVSRRSRTAVSRRSSTDSRFQNARKPPAGIWIAPVVPIPGHYIPPAGDAVHLLFREPMRHHVNLVFGRLGDVQTPTQIIIPVLRCYIVANSASLKRVSNNLNLPVFSMSVSIDADDPGGRWKWSAALPMKALADLEPDVDGDPVELEAVMNGSVWRLLIESRSERESFGSSSLQVSGYGLALAISSPQYPVMSYDNVSGARTAQQLADAALSFNGIPLGWALDWQIADWLVPAGVWVFSGSPLDAVSKIAAAAGGYVQAAAGSKVLRVLPRYPVAPWEWSSITPGLVLPSSAVLVRGTDHVSRAAYDSVYVSGAAGGVLAHVKRAGSSGELPAPMIVDPLITDAAAARGRGLEVLGNTGKQQIISLETGVLPDSGVIHVGTMMDWTRGGMSRRGIVRNLAVSASVPSGASKDPVKVRQTIGVETHG